MNELQLRATEDLELLEARLMDITSEKAELEKAKAEVERTT